MEYSHWNDFLMGPAIVSVLFSVAFLKIYGSSRNQTPISLGAPDPVPSSDLHHALRFARILMNVGLFWFFAQAWAEKAGYMTNPYSSDELDLPFEFVGTMLGFWMARALTKPFDDPPEKFRSTFFIDFLSSGVIGLFYTLIVGRLTEGIAGNVAHALSAVVPPSFEVHEYTSVQRHARPFELLLIAGAMWWGLNRSARDEEWTPLSSNHEPAAVDCRWNFLLTVAQAIALTAGCLLMYGTVFSILESQLGWRLTMAAAGLGAGTAALLLAKRAVFSGNRLFQSRDFLVFS